MVLSYYCWICSEFETIFSPLFMFYLLLDPTYHRFVNFNDLFEEKAFRFITYCCLNIYDQLQLWLQFLTSFLGVCCFSSFVSWMRGCIFLVSLVTVDIHYLCLLQISPLLPVETRSTLTPLFALWVGLTSPSSSRGGPVNLASAPKVSESLAGSKGWEENQCQGLCLTFLCVQWCFF